MNKEEWNSFCNVFKLDVKVEVPKEVTRIDIIQTLINEGEFIFKDSKDGFTSMNLSHLKGKATEKQIKVFESILWEQVKRYLGIKALQKGKEVGE